MAYRSLKQQRSGVGEIGEQPVAEGVGGRCKGPALGRGRVAVLTGAHVPLA